MQCQVCSKFGHTTLSYWHRFDQGYSLSIYVNPYNQRTRSTSGVGFGSYDSNVWMKPTALSRNVTKLSPSPSAFVVNTFPIAIASWFPDTRASFHFTNDAKNLQHLTLFEGPDQIFMENGQGLHIHSLGSSVFT